MRGRLGSRARLVPGNGPLARVPPAAAFLVVIVVFAVGAVVGGPVGAALLGGLFVGLLVLLAVTWSRLGVADRVFRVLVALVLLAVAISQVT